jgi:hypothetical protein
MRDQKIIAEFQKRKLILMRDSMFSLHERGPLSLVSTTEELPERKISGSGLEIREYSHWDLSR